jgi:hypothetical protein
MYLIGVLVPYKNISGNSEILLAISSFGILDYYFI